MNLYTAPLIYEKLIYSKRSKLGQTNPFIHGGKSSGSAGCIDLAENMNDFWE